MIHELYLHGFWNQRFASPRRNANQCLRAPSARVLELEICFSETECQPRFTSSVSPGFGIRDLLLLDGMPTKVYELHLPGFWNQRIAAPRRNANQGLRAPSARVLESEIASPRQNANQGLRAPSARVLEPEICFS